ncbi:HEPN domain-containing protein [Pseudomonas sp. CYM-20-01]|uniref:HEPN domain-containing protein n=1 Tax=Pseudomonas sp. CYM-20-01 TaxID=2870750 RepID=UPI0020BF3448|nr:HEPN domain-containing protein [Pseudomonas sp. CYM-20-01]
MDVLEHFRQRKDSAKERLAKLGGAPELCFAVSGLSVECDKYDFSRVAVLRRVEAPPGEIELAQALHRKSLLSAVARHMPSVTHELAVACDGEIFDQSNMNLGWWIISALRTRSQVDILVPAVADVSWDVIPAVEADACRIQLLEDVPAARRLDVRTAVSVDALDWVDAQLKSWINLLERPAFRLAVDAMTTHHHHANLRMSAAALWSGFEALFGINSELRFRLALLAAAYLEDRGPERVSLYRRIKKLYDYRSKAVHGGATTDEMLVDHIIEVRCLLSRLLCRMTEQSCQPSIDEFEVLLLS